MVRKVRRGAGTLAAAALFSGCGDRSEPFALPDGCYYAGDGTAVLRIQGDQGQILTPPPMPRPSGMDNSARSIRAVHLDPRVDATGPYVEVTPGVYLETPGFKAVTSGQLRVRFKIETRTARPAIMVFLEASGEEPLTLGPPCGAAAPAPEQG